MAIRKSKINIDTEERSDFDNMMNDVENEVEEQQAEDGLVNRVFVGISCGYSFFLCCSLLMLARDTD